MFDPTVSPRFPSSILGASGPPCEPRVLKLGIGTRVDLAAATVYRADQSIVHLTPAEHKLLGILVRYRGALVSVETLEADYLIGHPAKVIQRLRTRLGDTSPPSAVVNVRGLGYRLAGWTLLAPDV
jgi:DNA-binding response OmpR family regulator